MSDFAAVPSNEHQPYLDVEPVTDDEFNSWVKRSQADTDAVLAAWDDGVEFHQVESVEGSEAAVDPDRDEGELPTVPGYTYTALRNRVPRAPRPPDHEADRRALFDLTMLSIVLDADLSFERVLTGTTTLTQARLDQAMAAITPLPSESWESLQRRRSLEEQGLVILERRPQPLTNLWTPPPDPMIEAIRREYGL